MIFLISIIFTILLFQSDQIIKGEKPLLIVWNVGQGQWVTYSGGSSCIHFDMGGEFIEWEKVIKECKKKKNHLFLSHGDWDHIRWIKKMKGKINHICLQSLPQEPLHPNKKRYLNQFPLCKNVEKIKNFVYEVQWIKSLKFLVSKKQENQKNKKRIFKANDLSRIYIFKNQVLLPGDSTRKAEKIWSKKLKPFQKNIKWLLAPHHGSYTSSSKELLKALKKLKTVIISARKKRYGHPHESTLSRFREKKIAILRTEVWGNIKIEL